ncbi:hypothetical protein HZS_3885 [Henneguya salminicola]|nr:hypothetical protein HZS_3885 [Henneguya salminicola]
MTQKYTLHYFDIKARGELIRLIFHYKGVDFKDNRVLPDEWEDFKKDIAGNNNFEKAYLDQIVGGVEDVLGRLLPIIFLEPDADIKYPIWLECLQKLLATRENGQKFLLGNKITWADLALFDVIDLGLFVRGDSLSGFPLLEEYHRRMRALPTLANYLEKRAN